MITTLEVVEHVLRRPGRGRAGRIAPVVVIVLVGALAITQLIPVLPHLTVRDLGHVLDTVAGRGLLDGAWGWFGSS